MLARPPRSHHLVTLALEENASNHRCSLDSRNTGPLLGRSGGSALLQTTAATNRRSCSDMSQLPKVAASSSKAASPAGQNSPGASLTQQSFSNEGGQRRSGSASGNPRSSPVPRNQQNNKPKHKHGKKFRALDEDAEAELFSMQNPHGRKGQTSITHLMNFSLPPRPHQQNQYHRHNFNGPRRGGRGNPTWGLGSGYHAVDKAR